MTALVQILAQMSASGRPGILEMFLHAGFMGWIVAGVLIVLSLGSWAIMIGKFFHFRRAAHQSEEFLDQFRNSQRFSEVNAAAGRLTASPLVGIFQAGYVEIDAQVKVARQESGGEQGAYRIRSLAGLERSLQRALGSELALLARNSGFLATTAAAGPFIGLFGTVWGIMVAFQDIGVSGSTSLVAVAPGIAEALINTALGLGAAIPALMGYNFFSNRVRAFRHEMEDFVLEMINLAERNFT
jgi:biopolymer transport protein TolQ